MSDAAIPITRYPNRRFYDREASKYVSLEEIEELVRKGRKVEIRENQSGEEITRSVLTRIIMERQPEKMLLFPTEMLHFILQANDVMAGFLRDYLQHSIAYLEYLRRHGATAGSLVRPMHWVKAWLDGLAGPGQLPSEEEPAAGPDEAAQLVLRVRELEERLGQLEAQKDGLPGTGAPAESNERSRATGNASAEST